MGELERETEREITEREGTRVTQKPIRTRSEADFPVDPEGPETQNPKETRPSDEPRLDFRQAEARLPVDHWPVVLGAISGGSVRKSGDFQWRFFR
jgi:hypothetical protein